MDINKYLGKFLFKNKYCSLPGFGTLNLNVVGAKNNLAAIEPGNFNIQFSPVGSIDDKFANFIATNENISLDKASNVISGYCNEIKEAINVGSSFEVTGLGTFKNDVNGKLTFKQDEDINVSTFKFVSSPDDPDTDTNFQTRPAEEISFSKPSKPVTNINWSKILIPILVLGVLSAAGYFAFKYIQNKENTKTDETNTTSVNTDSLAFNNVPANDSVNSKDTSTVANTTAVTTVVDTNMPAKTVPPVPSDMRIAILTYSTQLAADEKSKKLASYGNNTSVVKGDSSKYFVAINVNSNGRPAQTVVDSLRRFFNPNEKNGKVFLLQ